MQLSWSCKDENEFFGNQTLHQSIMETLSMATVLEAILYF